MNTAMEILKQKWEKRYFVPWDIGMISKRWIELTPQEKEIAIPVEDVYLKGIKF